VVELAVWRSVVDSHQRYIGRGVLESGPIAASTSGGAAVTDESVILFAPLQEVKAAYSNVAPAAVDPRMLARRAQHFAEAMHFGVDQPTAMRRLHKASGQLANPDGLEGLLVRVLDTAITLTGADFGNVQLVDPATGALRIVTQLGFDTDFLDYFAIVDDAASTCGRAAKTGGQVLVTDTRVDPSYTPHRTVAEAAHFLAVQSTPMFTYSGELIGMVSTHFQRPHRPSDQELRVIGLFSDVAGEALASQLGAAHGLDPIGRALVTALLAPTNGSREPILIPPAESQAPPLLTDNPTGPANRLLGHPTSEETSAASPSAPQAPNANVKAVSVLLRERFGLGC